VKTSKKASENKEEVVETTEKETIKKKVFFEVKLELTI
jgi:hypothetical protein